VYVGISAFLNLLMSLLLGLECTMTGTIAIAHPSCDVPIHSNGDNTCYYGFGWILILILLESMEWCCVCWLWTSRKYVGILVHF